MIEVETHDTHSAKPLNGLADGEEFYNEAAKETIRHEPEATKKPPLAAMIDRVLQLPHDHKVRKLIVESLEVDACGDGLDWPTVQRLAEPFKEEWEEQLAIAVRFHRRYPGLFESASGK